MIRNIKKLNLAEIMKDAKFMTPEDAPVVVRSLRAGNPSGEAPPMGDIPGWKDIYTDDFTEWRWDDWSFPYGFNYEHSYVAGITNVGNSLMTFPFSKKSENEPLVVSWSMLKNKANVQYGKFLVRMRADKHYGHAFAALTWPSIDQDWPKYGEIDFAEDYTGERKFGAFSHFQNAQGEHEQTWHIDDAPNVDGSEWHTWGCEWTPTSLKYTLDGKVWAQETDPRAIPHNPHWLGFVGAAHFPANLGEGKVEVDWIKIYSYDPETQGEEPQEPKPTDPTPEVKPTIGRIVHYMIKETIVPAIVTKVNGDGALDLTVFRANQLAYVKKAPKSDQPKAKHWSWPPK